MRGRRWSGSWATRSGPRGLGPWALCAAAMVTAGGCSKSAPQPRTGVLLVVRADDALCAALRSVKVVAEGRADGASEWEAAGTKVLEVSEGCLSWPKYVALWPKEDEASRWFRVTVEGYEGDEAQGPVVVATRVMGQYVAGRRKLLEVVLYATCAATGSGGTCGETQMCEADGCKPLMPVDVGSLPDVEPRDGGPGDGAADGPLPPSRPDGGPDGNGGGDAAVEAGVDGGPVDGGPACEPSACAASVSCPECQEAGCLDDGTCGCKAVADGTACSDDGNECTRDACVGGSCEHPAMTDGTPCSCGTCSGGACRWSWRDVFVGYGNVCAVAANGTLWCWGWNRNGQLGLGDTEDRTTPTQVGTDANWNQVAVGAYHGCGVRMDGTLWCWGDNQYGQLGLGSWDGFFEPIQVGRDGGWQQVSVGDRYSCALKSGGTIYCWGANWNGRIGIGGSEDARYNEPQLVSGADWIHVAVGYAHVCGINGVGNLFCWGANQYGQLGMMSTGGVMFESMPQGIGSSVWDVVEPGNAFTCGIQSNGTLWCWGYNGSGELGLGDNMNRTSPSRVGSSMQWRNLSSGQAHACAVRMDGTLWCWGDNQYGQLGLGHWDDKDEPTQVGSETNWRQVMAGSYHTTCGLRNSGSLHCWGNNQYGQLGLGDSGMGTERRVPTLVPRPDCSP